MIYLLFAIFSGVINLLNEEPVVKQITNGSNIKYESLKVENLSFSYDGQAEILKNINIAIILLLSQ